MRAQSTFFAAALVGSLALHLGIGAAFEYWGEDEEITIGEEQQAQVLRIRSVPEPLEPAPEPEKVEPEPKEEPPAPEPTPPEPKRVVPDEKPKEEPVTKPEPVKKVKKTEKVERPKPPVVPPQTGDLEQQQALQSSFESKLLAWLARHKQYPRMARRRGIEGTSTLSFTVKRDGSLQELALKSSSGSDLLDQETVAMAKRAEPFPGFPKELRKAAITLTVPVTFELR